MTNQSWRVPDVDVREKRDPAIAPLPKGIYRCKIVDFGTPQPSKVREFNFHMRIRLKPVDSDRYLYAYVAGFLSIVMMVYRARKHWIDSEVDVRVCIHNWNGYERNTADIIWTVEPIDESNTD